MTKNHSSSVTKYIIFIPVISLTLLSVILIFIVIQTQNQHLEEDKIEFKTAFLKTNSVLSNSEITQELNNIINRNIKDSREYYNTQNNKLILISSLITLIVITISVILARNIASKLNQTNKTLYRKVDEKTKELQENLAFMNKLLNIMPIPVFIKDENFRYIKCNDALCDFLNLNKDEIIGKSVYDLAPNNLADEYHKKDLELLNTENQKYRFLLKKCG
ncbi:MAG: PAS domain-containing protein [Campylobacterota bacterium]|nr:PAS domain-containing protein [Campylobacterota bacterium]